MRKQLTVLHTTSTVLTNIGYSLNPLLNYLQREKREDTTHNIFILIHTLKTVSRYRIQKDGNKMRTICTKVYQFNELSNEAKEKAISRLSDINVSYDWWMGTYEDAAMIGLKITSFGLDRNRHAKGEFTMAANEVAQNILTHHGENCETYKTAASFMEDWQPVFNNYMDENHEDYESNESEGKLQDIEDEFLNSLLEDYSIMLQNECEYLQTDEAIIHAIEQCDYEFTNEGNLFS